MRSSKRYLVIFIAFVLLFQMNPVYKVRAEGIIFGDPILEKAIRSQLAYDGPITEEMMASLNYLDITKGEVKSLQGLEYAINMEYLTISQNQVTDISPLSNMKKLCILEMPGNKISDLSPLMSLTELTHIYLSDNQISNISALSGLTKLEYLSINNNKINDLTPLAALTALKELYVVNNKITSIEPVRSLTSLETFAFSDNQVTALSSLQDLKNLKEVSAANNCINLKDKANQNAIVLLKQNKVAVNTDNQKVKEQEVVTKKDIKLTWKTLYDETIADSDYHLDTDEYTYGNGIYVSKDGYTSKDGVKWKKNSEFKDVKLVDIAWGKNKFVGLGYEGKTWISKDGIHWTLNKQVFDSNGMMDEIAFSGKIFVAVGGNSYGGRIFSSEDGINWTVRSKDIFTDIKGVAWGNGTFVAMGYEGAICAVSKDGIKWKKVKLPFESYYNLWNICYANGVFVAVGDCVLVTSKDGVNWTAHSSNGIYWSDIYWVKDRFYLEGFRYADERKKKEIILINRTSRDGKTWTDLKSSTTGFEIETMEYDGKNYVSYPYKGKFTSSDGVNWKLKKSTNHKPWDINRSAIGNGKLVAVGGDLDILDPEVESFDFQGLLQISPNGTNKYSMVKGKYPLYDLVWTGKRFFAVGYQGLMMSSTDGLKWVESKSPTSETLYRIIKVKNTYYVTGTHGLILSSKDLKTWVKQKTNVKSDIKSIAWNGKTFVAVGDEALMLVSDNGIKWSKVKRSDTNNYSDIVWAKGTFVVTSSDTSYSTKTSMLYKSADGKKWTESSLSDNWSREGVGEGYYGIYYTGDLFVALGCGGTISLSEDAVHWTIQDVSMQMIMKSAQVLNNKMYVFGSRSIVYVADLKDVSR